MARRVPAVTLAALLCGCPLFGQQQHDQPTDQNAEIDPAEYAEQVDAKLRRFASCRDIVASVMSESWARYSDQVDAQGKPRRRREGVYLRGIGSNAFRTCERVLEAAKTPPPMPVIERETAKLVAAGSRYAELTRMLSDYLGDDGGRGDEWARLAELDPQLRAAHEVWHASDDALQQAIDLRHVENDPILLGVLEGRRSPLEVASRKLMIHARPMVRCMTGEHAEHAEHVQTDSDCTGLHSEFDAAAAEFSRIYQGERAAADKVFWMATFANDVEEFRAIAAELVRKLGQRKPKPADLQPLTDAYSSLVRDAETLDFDFP